MENSARKNTQMVLPTSWPSGLHKIEELCLDPVEATGPWPSLQGCLCLPCFVQTDAGKFQKGTLLAGETSCPLRIHLRTTRPRLALQALPCSIQAGHCSESFAVSSSILLLTRLEDVERCQVLSLTTSAKD